MDPSNRGDRVHGSLSVKTPTKKQLQARVKRLERKNRQLEGDLRLAIFLAKEFSQMVPPPNYNYAEGM